MTLIPEQMVILKGTFPKLYESAVISNLQKLGLTEFIDVEAKAHTSVRKLTEERRKVYEARERLSYVIRTLRANYEDSQFSRGGRVRLEGDSLETTLKFAEEVLKKHEEIAKRLDKEIGEAKRILEDIGKAEEVFGQVHSSELAMMMLGRQHNVKLNQPSYESEGEYITASVGIVDGSLAQRLEWSLKEATDNRCYIEIAELDELNSVILVTHLRSEVEKVKPVLREHAFKELELPPSLRINLEEVPLETLRNERENLEQKLEVLEKERKEYWEQNGKELLAAQEVVEIEVERLAVSLIFRETEYSLTFWAWTPKSKVDYLQKVLKEVTGGKIIMEATVPTFEKKHFPTYLPSRKVSEPFQNITNSYGLPGYKEYNPTPIMLFTFPLIFGLMFADIGHGIILIAIGIYATRLRRRGYQGGEFANYIVQAGELILLCGISAVTFGLVFGSVFGREDVIHALWFSPFEGLAIVPGAEANGGEHYVDIFSFKLDPVMAFLVMSFIVGIIHISSGLMISFISAIRNQEHFEHKALPFFLLWAYIGGVSLVWRYGTQFGDWGAPLEPIPGAQFLYLVILPLVILSAIFAKHGVDGIMEVLERVLALLSNTISYARILALLMVHGVLTQLFNALGEGMGEAIGIGEIGGLYIGIIIGCLIVIPLEGLLSFIHTLRLHYVEWFSKWYFGEGHEFEPFVYERIYTEVSEIAVKPVAAPAITVTAA
ncbi:MAG: V-type ATP synthase subunit I [Candidatus Hodarchaeota archaeon]